MSLFVTGTDTNVGKTFVSVWLAYHLKSNYWKPIQTGILEDRDTLLAEALNIHTYPETYSLIQPLSPNQASEMENISISMAAFPTPYDNTIIEGAGGVMVPLHYKNTNSKTLYNIDLIQHMECPVVVVARSSLGTLNHTFLTVEALQKRKIPILFIILNGEENKKNSRDISLLTSIPIISFPYIQGDMKQKLSYIKSFPINSKNYLSFKYAM